MGDLSKHDLELWKFKGSQRASTQVDNALATATLAAPGPSFRNRVVKVDASYSLDTTSGLLQIKSGASVIMEKYIHGSGALDFSDYGLAADNRNEAVSAELAASGVGGVFGTVTISGFKHPDSSI